MTTEEIDAAIKAKIKELLPKMIVELRARNLTPDWEPAITEEVAFRTIDVGRFSTGIGIRLDGPAEARREYIEVNVASAMIGLVEVMFDVIAPRVEPGDMLNKCPKLRDEVERIAGLSLFDEEYEEFVASLGYERRPVRSSVIVGG